MFLFLADDSAARQRRGIYVAFPDVHRLFLSIDDCQKHHICQAYSSTYAETFYTSLGFKKVGEKEINKGIVSIPMERNI